jgi:3-dehydroquinate dehydratase/shikimate dehydrogenase
MIIVSITGPRMQDAVRQLRSSARHADLIELRLDLISRPDIPLLLASTRKPAVATCRPDWEGGRFSGSERRRLEMLDAAAASGAAYVDLELAVAREAIPRFRSVAGGPEIICSHHLYSPRRFSVQKAYRQLSATGAEVLKLAYMAEDACDIRTAVEFLSLARRGRKRAMGLAMGLHGEPSRVLYKKLGGWATYASAADGEESAPGQITAATMKRLYRADRLTRRARVFGVVGNPLTQSKGIYVHNHVLRNEDAVYCRFLVENLGRFMKDVAPLLHGFSVTIPFKETIIRHLAGVDRAVRPIKAVNTAVRRRGGFWGTNSDAPGALDAIEKIHTVRGQTVLVVGAGGTARAIAYEAKRRGAAVIIANRSPKKGKRLAREFGLEYLPLEEIGRRDFDVLVNATPVGMVPQVNHSPVPSALLRDRVVFDAVYNPPVTKLLREARASGATVVDGTEMFLNQAAIQSHLFTGRPPDLQAMRKVLRSVASPE